MRDLPLRYTRAMPSRAPSLRRFASRSYTDTLYCLLGGGRRVLVYENFDAMPIRTYTSGYLRSGWRGRPAFMYEIKKDGVAYSYMSLGSLPYIRQRRPFVYEGREGRTRSVVGDVPLRCGQRV